MYIDIKSTLEIYEMQEKYEIDTWQRDILSAKVSNLINEKNTHLYGENKDTKKVKEIEESINKVLEKLDEGDWKYFAKEELEQAKNQLDNLEEQKENTEDKQELQSLESAIQSAKIDQEVAKIRINKEIPYGSDFKNRALNNYQTESKNVITMKNSGQELDYKEKQEYNTSLETKELSQYIFENNVDINKPLLAE